MNFGTWLDGERGRLTETAKRFGRTPGAVSQWRAGGVPVEHMKAIVDWTGGAVTLDDLVPDPKQAPTPTSRASAAIDSVANSTQAQG